MKRTGLMKIVLMTGILLLSVKISGVCIADASKPAAPESAAASQTNNDTAEVKSDAREAATETPTADTGMMVTLKFPIDAPAFSQVPVATVNEDPITLDEFNDAAAAVHMTLAGGASGASSDKSFSELLKRLITIRLFVEEAKNIGLDQLPEVRSEFEEGSKKLQRETLYRQLAKDVKPDEKAVEKAYKAVTKQVKLTLLEFGKEEDAKNFKQGLAAGKNFDELAEKAVKDGLAKKSKEDAGFQKNSELLPQVSQVVEALEPMGVSPVVPLSDHFLLIKLLEVKYVDDPQLKEAARERILTNAKLKALTLQQEALIKKYMKQNTKLINKVDFDAKKPGIEKLLKDKRVLVTVKGGGTITVADLAEALRDKFYHGVKLAAEEKKVNRAKEEVLGGMMSKIAFAREASARKIETSEEYKKNLDKLTKTLLFGTFIEKVVRPEVKGNEADLEAYYKAHLKEFTYPEMVVIDAVAFNKSADAKSAIEKLRQGMDLGWLKLNAEGLVSKDAADLVNFDAGNMVTTKSLPEGAQKALSGVRTGDYRLYEPPQGYYYVLYVQSVAPERPQPLSEVREAVAKQIYGDLFSKTIDGWYDKLRKSYVVKIYLDLPGKNNRHVPEPAVPADPAGK